MLKKIGFDGFSKDLWRTYIGVIEGGVKKSVHFPVRSEEILTDHIKLGKHALFVSSMSLRWGNKSQIMIDFVDYSLNRRGLNIVIASAIDMKVIDSINYDVHHCTTRSFSHLA